jgi:hypothetical protein
MLIITSEKKVDLKPEIMVSFGKVPVLYEHFIIVDIWTKQ